MGILCLKNSISSFKNFLLLTQGNFINGMNMTYRMFIVGLAMNIEEKYLDSAMAAILIHDK